MEPPACRGRLSSPRRSHDDGAAALDEDHVAPTALVAVDTVRVPMTRKPTRPCSAPIGEHEELLERIRGFERAAQQRVADLRTQLARAEEFAVTLAERLTRTPAP